MTKTIQEFLAAASGEASFREMGRASGINHSTIRRQLLGEGEMTAPVVIQLARTYNADVIDALVAAGFITEDDASGHSTSVSLRNATDIELAQEILRRASDGSASSVLTEPLPDTSNVIVGGFGQNASTEEIPENVEEEWAGLYAAQKKGVEPEEHTP
ncbi:hypothetical protein [Leucobacter sp. 1207-22]|uniref:hypothetical protein n=1 Tax=Leucobacter sp. 1207-22 TaxID=2604456 RepID=UPI004062CA18